MIILKKSFKDYLNLKKNDSNLSFEEEYENKLKQSLMEMLFSEMPVPPISFKDKDGNYSDEKHHAAINAPIFMDEDDILYLYQFPPEFWTHALAYRYVDALYEAKVNPNYNDIQNIKLGDGSRSVIFRNRNTFAKKLVDKIERTVDVDHFMNAKSNDPDLKKQYAANFEKYGKEGKDLGGLFGTDMSSPVRRAGTNLWVAKGMMAPDEASIKRNVSQWMSASSHGILEDPDDYTGNPFYMKLGGGRGMSKGKRYLSVSYDYAAKLLQKMKSVGAKPFNLHRFPTSPKDAVVSWDDVSYDNKKNASGFFLEKGQPKHSKIPILFPGKALDSNSNTHYEALQSSLGKAEDVSLSDVKDVDSLGVEISKLNDELSQTKDRARKVEINKELKNLVSLVPFMQFVKDSGKTPKSEIELEDLKKLYSRKVHDEMKLVGKNAKKYDAYDWAFHQYNQNRKDHDPLGVGMANPVAVGEYEHERLMNKATTYGSYFPNRQNKTTLVGGQGDWEDFFHQWFGITDGFKNKYHLESKEINELEREVDKYVFKISDKLSNDPKVLSFLGLNKQDAKMVLTSSSSLAKAMRGSQGTMPKSLEIALDELKTIESEIKNLDEASSTGFNKSDILSGVELAVSKTIHPIVKMILNNNKLEIAWNAENHIKKNMGMPVFKKLMNSMKSGNLGTIQKHKLFLDAKQQIKSYAQNYAVTISQLPFGNADSDQGSISIASRRKRDGSTSLGNSSFSAFGGEDGGDELDSIHGRMTSQLKRVSDMSDDNDDKFSISDTGSDDEKIAPNSATHGDSRVNQMKDIEIIDDIAQSYFGDLGKNAYRKHRSNSDSTGVVGHNVNVIRTQIEREAKTLADKSASNAKIGADNLKEKLSSISQQEIDMIKKINDSLALYNFFVTMYNKKKIGPPENSHAWAKQRMESVLKRHGSYSMNDLSPDSIRYSQETIDQKASKLYDSLEASYEPDQLDIEIQKIVNKASTDEEKQFADRLLVLHGKERKFSHDKGDGPVALKGGLKDTLAKIAAKKSNSQAVKPTSPSVDNSADDVEAMFKDRMKNRRATIPTTNVSTPNPTPPSTPTLKPNVPNTTNPTPSTQPPISAADRLRRLRKNNE